MTPGNIDVHINKLTEGANGCVLFSEYHADGLSFKLKEQATLISERCEWRISDVTAQLTSYVSYVYLNTNHRIDQVVFHHSPSLFGIIAWISIAVSNIILFVKNIVDILHIVEILKAADVLAVIWPQFRVRLDEIYGKVAEASQSLGFGVDGLIHLIQATQGGISVLGGVLGKDDIWSEAQIGEQALNTTQRIAVLIHQFENNPSYAFQTIFREQDWNNKRKVSEWWDGVDAWITKTTDQAEKALSNLSHITSDFLSLKLYLPKIIRDNIPEAVWDNINKFDSLIDNNILPKLANINGTLVELNSVIDSQRKNASELANKLAHPGDVMLGLDLLSDNEKKDQESKIDDVASRKYNEDTDKYEKDDAEIIAELNRVEELFKVPVEPLPFMTLEAMPGKVAPGIIKEPFETWFVGGYESKY